MPFHIVRNDITRMRVDAVVNAANEQLRQGGGVCGAIFAAAGARELQQACNKIGHVDTGDSVATPAFGLDARHIIHTAGPIWRGGMHGERAALEGCYRSALALASSLGDTSIAFPLISSGIYGYPKEEAIDVALTQIRAFLEHHEMEVYLTLFDTQALRAAHGRFGRITEYINDQYAQESPYHGRARWEQQRGVSTMLPYQSDADKGSVFDAAASDTAAWPCSAGSSPSRRPQPKGGAAPSAPAPSPSSVRSSSARHAGEKPRNGFLRRLLDRMDAPFSTTLIQMIDKRGMKDSDVYKRANMSRQHFSKIRSNPSYRPKKQTVLALAVALGLSIDETKLLLERAGFALTHADERDVIVEYFIREGIYDIYEINLALYAFDQPLLG